MKSTGRMLKSKSEQDRQTDIPTEIIGETLIHIWISLCYSESNKYVQKITRK